MIAVGVVFVGLVPATPAQATISNEIQPSSVIRLYEIRVTQTDRPQFEDCDLSATACGSNFTASGLIKVEFTESFTTLDLTQVEIVEGPILFPPGYPTGAVAVELFKGLEGLKAMTGVSVGLSRVLLLYDTESIGSGSTAGLSVDVLGNLTVSGRFPLSVVESTFKIRAVPVPKPSTAILLMMGLVVLSGRSGDGR
jgi:hypothetical protein